MTEISETTAAEIIAAGGSSTPLHSAAAPMGAGGSGRQTPVGNSKQATGKKRWFTFGSKAATESQEEATTEEEGVVNAQQSVQATQVPKPVGTI